MDWINIEEIAKSLVKNHPDKNYLTCSQEDLRLLVISLPEFSGSSHPPDPFYFSSIAFSWVEYATLPEEDSPYDNRG
jgi:FeS assembly protein IscX